MNVRIAPVVALGLVTIAALGCSSEAGEKTGRSANAINDKAEIIGNNYVETWESIDDANARANDMRSIGLDVDQRGHVLYVAASEYYDVASMMDAASSDEMNARWGPGSETGLTAMALPTGSMIGKRDVTLAPHAWEPFELTLHSQVRLNGSFNVTPNFSLRPSGCGRGCFRFDGTAGVSFNGFIEANVEGSLAIESDVYDLGEWNIGKIITVLPGPIPIPVYADIYVKPAVSCFGQFESSAKYRADFNVGYEANYWASISKGGLDGGGSTNPTGTGVTFQPPERTGAVSFGCTIPKIQIGARFYKLGGPFVSFGPAIVLSADANESKLEYQMRAGIGAEADNLGLPKYEYAIGPFTVHEQKF